MQKDHEIDFYKELAKEFKISEMQVRNIINNL